MSFELDNELSIIIPGWNYYKREQIAEALSQLYISYLEEFIKTQYYSIYNLNPNEIKVVCRRHIVVLRKNTLIHLLKTNKHLQLKFKI